jgi:Arylsulfotransferase (ASST)
MIFNIAKALQPGTILREVDLAGKHTRLDTRTVVYSHDDGNLLLSMRHQSWILKIDYENGTGSGNSLDIKATSL